MTMSVLGALNRAEPLAVLLAVAAPVSAAADAVSDFYQNKSIPIGSICRRFTWRGTVTCSSRCCSFSGRGSAGNPRVGAVGRQRAAQAARIERDTGCIMQEAIG